MYFMFMTGLEFLLETLKIYLISGRIFDIQFAKRLKYTVFSSLCVIIAISYFTRSVIPAFGEFAIIALVMSVMSLKDVVWIIIIHFAIGIGDSLLA